jgi:type VI secretion system secreted protein VgrG
VPDDTKPGWIEFRIVDDAGLPAAGERYRIRLPDGSVAEGRTGATGVIRLAGIDAGDCEITLPDQNQDSWERVEENQP